jgi:hypothetical protein
MQATEVATSSSSSSVPGSVVAPSAASAGEAVSVSEPDESRIDDFIATLSDTFETCKTVYEKPTKDQDEWYYYCGKVIDQISQTEEFHTTRELLYTLVISNLLEHMFFQDSLTLVNYLYQKNNYNMTTTTGATTPGAGSIQLLSPFERLLLNYYEQHIIARPLVGRRAAAAAASEGARRTPQDQGLLLFHEKKKEQYELIVLRYETREWVVAEPEDLRDYEVLLGNLQTSHIQTMNMIIGFVSFFKKEYLIFKVKNITKKRDKGARCDQSGKTETITIINTILMMNPETQGDDYKLTIENTKQRTQKELCVFQEFLLRTFNANRVGGKKWFFAPGEALLCNIEGL